MAELRKARITGIRVAPNLPDGVSVGRGRLEVQFDLSPPSTRTSNPLVVVHERVRQRVTAFTAFFAPVDGGGEVVNG